MYLSNSKRDIPTEILQTILDFVPRSNLAQLALVSRQFNSIASPLLYRHIYIRTLYHWERFLSCCRSSSIPPWLASVTSLVLQPSPKLIPRSTGSFMSARKTLMTDKDVEAQGYMRLQPVNFDWTGLEFVLAKDNDQQYTDGDETRHDFGSENYAEMNTTIKEAEWLTKVTDMDMAHVITRCPHLVYLQVSGCTQIGDATMYALAASQDDNKVGRAGGMQGLWIDLARQISSVAWMTFVHAEQKRPSPGLHHLDLSYCGFVTDHCLTKALPLWSSTLTHLRLCSLYSITDATVHAIAEHCPHLRLLHLTRCFRVTNRSIISLATSPLAATLTYLSVAFLNQVNEEGVKHLVYCCENLRFVNISGSGINPMFKLVFLKQWEQARERKQWPKIHFQENPVLLF